MNHVKPLPRNNVLANARKNMVYAHLDNGLPVTLNGVPASVCGYHNDFATVASYGSNIQAGEWSWSAIERVLSNGGAFKM